MKWKARIRLPGGQQQDVFVEADTQTKAKLLIEAQYGKGKIISGPVSMR